MVALNFMKRFAPDVEQGIKRRTFRLESKRRPPRVGETLQLYTGMRTKSCRLLATAICTDVQGCILEVGRGRRGTVLLRVETLGKGATAQHLSDIDALDEFARRDGFDDWSALVAFFRPRADRHGRVQGNLIHWRPS